MKDTHIVGKTVAIGQPAHILYGAFSDMRNFVERLPEDKIDCSKILNAAATRGVS